MTAITCLGKIGVFARRHRSLRTRAGVRLGLAALLVFACSGADADLAGPGTVHAVVGIAGTGNPCTDPARCTVALPAGSVNNPSDEGSFPVSSANQQVGTVTGRAFADVSAQSPGGPTIALDVKGDFVQQSGAPVTAGLDASASWHDMITLEQANGLGVSLFDPVAGVYELEWQIGFNGLPPSSSSNNILDLFSLVGGNRFNAEYAPGPNCVGCTNGVALTATFASGAPAGADLQFGLFGIGLAGLLSGLLNGSFEGPVPPPTPGLFTIVEDFVPPPAGGTFDLGLEVTEALSLQSGDSGELSFNDPVVLTLFDPSGNIVPGLIFGSELGATYNVTEGFAPPHVPEPPSWMLLLAGLAVIRLGMRRRRYTD